jgi:O-antigen/teichoic acid export membrane protein
MKFPWNSKSPSGFKIDLVASLTGSAWLMLVQLVCIPLYIRFLGIEAYGLIGFYLMLQVMLQVLDLGLSPTMNREMARYSVQPEKAGEARDLVRTLEVGYWLIGIVIGLALVTASPWIATHWIKASTIPVRNIKQAVMLVGVLAAFQWPVSFYQGGLLGLHKQVRFNVLRVIATTVSNGGAVLVLWLISPTIQAFFVWLVAANAVMLVFWTIFLWKSLPSATRAPQFNFGLLRSCVGFAAGMSGITASALILTQSDKVILSSVLSLKVFGYYTVGGVFGSGLSLIITSMFNTTYPRFSALVAQGDERALVRLYHGATQVMAVLILPVAAVLALFSTDVLQLWTRNSEVAHNAGPIAALLVIGSAVNGLMFLPYTLQLAYGWTNIGLRINICLTMVFVPAIWFMATTYGAIGAASMWPALNCIYMAIGVPLTHRRLLKGEALRWLRDIALPFVSASFVAVIGKRLAGATMSPLVKIVVLLGVLFCAASAAALVSSAIRPWLISQLLKVKILRAKPAC